MTDANDEVQAVDPADAKLFMANNFWVGGNTSEVRLDEIHAMKASQLRGETEVMGDTSANEIVDEILNRARLFDHRKYADLRKAFAKALVELAGDYPSKWLNPQWDHPARSILYQGLSNDPNAGARGEGTVNNQPSAEQVVADGKPPVQTESAHSYADLDLPPIE